MAGFRAENNKLYYGICNTPPINFSISINSYSCLGLVQVREEEYHKKIGEDKKIRKAYTILCSVSTFFSIEDVVHLRFGNYVFVLFITFFHVGSGGQ